MSSNFTLLLQELYNRYVSDETKKVVRQTVQQEEHEGTPIEYVAAGVIADIFIRIINLENKQ